MQGQPRIIAVKGLSSSSKMVSSQLADHLKYSLMDRDDLASAPLDSLPSQNLNNLSFKILYQIASAPLRDLKPGVVINLSLLSSESDHLDQLKQLAKSLGNKLILIQCQSSDQNQINNNDPDVQMFSVDSDTTSFIVDKFVSEKRGFGFPQAADPIQTKIEKPKVLLKSNLVKTSSFRPSREKVPEKIYRHMHDLRLHTAPTASKARLKCKICQKDLSVPSYHCLDCDEYVFHKSCAESPGNLEHVRKDCPQCLRAREPKYEFPKEQVCRCKICEDSNIDFPYDCHDCLFQTNIKGKLLPVVVNHESHAHPLILIMAPSSLNYEFGCCGCGELGKSMSYRCYDCNFNLHVSCVLLDRTVPLKHDRHTFKFTYGSLEENCWDKSYCKFCKKEIQPEQWFYNSPATESVAHIGCASAAYQGR